jgi:uncharacterized membrane protein
VTLEHALIWVTLALAVGAVAVNGVAATRGPSPLRIASAARAGLAVVYVAAYIWLLANPTKRLAWSKTLAGVAIVAWVVVWIVPAITALHLERSYNRAVEQAGDE